MLNKFRTEPEIFALKVDPIAAKEEKHFLQSLKTFKAGTKKVAGNKEFYVLTFS
jgi:hypothetical protein